MFISQYLSDNYCPWSGFSLGIRGIVTLLRDDGLKCKFGKPQQVTSREIIEIWLVRVFV